MPVLDNPKHERFAQGLAKGKTQIASYVDAGYKPDDGAANRLSGNVRIQARVAELLTRAAEKAEFTVAQAMEQVDEDRKFARSLNQASAAVAASTLKLKLFGMLVDRVQADVTQHEVTSDPESTVEQWQSLTPSQPVQGNA